MRVRIRDAAQPLSGEADHFVGYIDPVDLAEKPAEGAHQTAGSAADLEGGIASRQALEVPRKTLDEVRGRAEELLVILLAAAERDVVVGVLGGALVPVRAHSVENLGIFHAGQFF